MASNTTSTLHKLGAFLILILFAYTLLTLNLGYEVYEVKKMLSQGDQPEVKEPLSEGSKNIGKRDILEMDFDAKLKMDFHTLSETTPPKTEEVRVNSEFTKYVRFLWNKGLISVNPGNGSLSKPAIHLQRKARTKKEDLCHYGKENDITNLKPVTLDGNKLLEFDGKNRVKITIPGYYYIYSQAEYQLTASQKEKIKKIYLKKIKKSKIINHPRADGHVVCRNQNVLLESYFLPFEIVGNNITFTSTTLTNFNGGIFAFKKDDTLWIRNLGPISRADHQIYFGAFYFDFPPPRPIKEELIESSTPAPLSISSTPSTPRCKLEEETLFITRFWTRGTYFCFSLRPYAHCPHACHAEKKISTVHFHCILSTDKKAADYQESYKKEKRVPIPRGTKTTIYEEVEVPMTCRHPSSTD